MKTWNINEEELAKEEYLSMIDTLRNSEEFENDWTGEWNDFPKESFGKKIKMIKGDKNKFMRYWIENQKIINDLDLLYFCQVINSSGFELKRYL